MFSQQQAEALQKINKALVVIERQRGYAEQQLDDPDGYAAHKCLDNIALHTEDAQIALKELLASPATQQERPRFVKEISIIDPDTHGEVELEVYKTSGGGMIAIDATYLEQVRTLVPSPFDDHVLLDLSEDEHEEDGNCTDCHPWFPEA